MASMRPIVFALLGALTIAAVTPAHAQTMKPKKSSPAKAQRKAERKMERKAERADMANGMMMPMANNNTAATQANIDRANKSLSDLVALLDQIDARKKTQ